MENVIFTNVAPLRVEENKTIKRKIKENILKSDKIVIAVGYFSNNGLETLDKWIHEANIKNITLIGGMYSVEGIPVSVFNKIIDIDFKWNQEKIGRILLVNNMNYHGKLYTFWKNGRVFKSIIGSANLGAIAPTGSTQRQYELATTVTDSNDNEILRNHLAELEKYTTPANEIEKSFKKIYEENVLLKGIDGVTTLTDETVIDFKRAEDGQVLRIPIKAPYYKDRFNDDNKSNYTHSNINVCYGRGRKALNGKIQPRNWFEVQITCSRELINLKNYPKKSEPFFIVTDDNYMFEAHTTSANHKQLSAYGSDRILGRWIKGRLVSAGLLHAYDNAGQDKNRDGMVTIEMLERSHMKVLELHKTKMKFWGKEYQINPETHKLDKKIPPIMKALDVWFANFSNDLGNEK